ncbi:hypothetical protein RSOLAG1IB_10689 [Rhizoctonia solani AG-1 IB]|uniref:Transmembrane protein n=2 Tax=Thanatephorus cucumeris (strain AG1-IB / isolate 7/3/14) TaxID=1108050 RepID=A0A0B7FZF5_THACB|nr:hypothetical protein RSOLAG1IB_10689 [Rhizoctonia solani AG-1 IB]
MSGRHPCERGRRCSCQRAGPSTRTTPKKKKTTRLITAAAALVCPVLAAPTPQPTPHLPFLYPSLDKRVTDAGQAPDDPSEGFEHQHIQLADLIRAGLPYKFVYDSDADVGSSKTEELALTDSSGAWVIDNSWSLHGRRFGPLYATATAGITDDPLPTPTESVPPASTPTATTTAPPTLLAIQSSLPTGWDSSQYERSDMYAIPLVVSFALVIALMIGSLIGALVIRRDRSRSRRRKKRIVQENDGADSAREKVARSSLVSRVGRALNFRNQPHQEEQPEDTDPRTELEHRVKTWARRSATWRAQARLGVRRRIGRGHRRYQADSGPDTPMGGAIQEEPEPEEEGPTSTRAPSPVAIVPSRASSPIVTDIQPAAVAAAASSPQTPAPNYPSPTVPNYASPTVPTYSSPPPAAGPSTSPLARIEAHPDATPDDEPAYDGPGAGEGLPPAYRGAPSQVARGKRPAHSSSPAESIHEPDTQPQNGPEERRVWTELDAYAFNQEGRREESVTAHVAKDDKDVLKRLYSMRDAPGEQEQEQEVHAPREEDVFGSSSGPSTPGGSLPTLSTATSTSIGGVPAEGGGRSAHGLVKSEPAALNAPALPLPPTKTGTGPVARYDEADLCLPRYLDGSEGMHGVGGGLGIVSGVSGMGIVPSAPEGMGLMPSAPEGIEMASGTPMEHVKGMVPSAPPCEEVVPSAPVLADDEALDDGDRRTMPVPSAPSAPPLEDDPVPSAPPNDHSYPVPSAPPSVPSAPPVASAPPLHEDTPALDNNKSLHQPVPRHDAQSAPDLRRTLSSTPLLDDKEQ